MQSPQFPTQNDFGNGDGIAPIPQWQEAAVNMRDHTPPSLNNPDLDPAVGNILLCLRKLFHEPRHFDLSSTDLHDLVCFVLHRLLSPPRPPTANGFSPASAFSECIRYALVLYMFIIHGTTYFSHAQLQYSAIVQLRSDLESSLVSLGPNAGSLTFWLLSIGMVASEGTSESYWFRTQCGAAAETFGLSTWEAVQTHLEDILWSKTQPTEYQFKQRWEEIWKITPV